MDPLLFATLLLWEPMPGWNQSNQYLSCGLVLDWQHRHSHSSFVYPLFNFSFVGPPYISIFLKNIDLNVCHLYWIVLTLFWHGREYFYPLVLFGSVLSAEFFSKISKLFWRCKLTSIRLIWHPARLIESYAPRWH